MIVFIRVFCFFLSKSLRASIFDIHLHGMTERYLFSESKRNPVFVLKT